MNDAERIHELCREAASGDNEMLKRLARFYQATRAGLYLIRNVHEDLVPLTANRAQLAIHRKMMEQAAAGKPVRISILKARKVGASTWIQTLLAHLCEYYPLQEALTVAHESTATEKIFTIARRAVQKHGVSAVDVNKRDIGFPDKESHYHAMTAGGVAVSAGGSPNLLHHSEIPKWERNRDETHYNTVNAVAKTPTSIIAAESTAKGRDTLFYQPWKEANDNPDGSEYATVFLPWFIDENCVADVPKGYKLEMDSDEQALLANARRYGIELSREALYWRRLKVHEIGLHTFRQEYPSTPEEAVQATEGLIITGLRDCLFDELPFDPEHLPGGEMNRVGGIDFGFADAHVQWSGFYVMGEVWLTTYYRRIEGLAKDHVEGLDPGVVYFCDPSALTARKELERAASNARIPGVRFHPSPRKKRTGENTIENELKMLIGWIQTGRVNIQRACADQLLTEADDYCWNPKTGKPLDTRSELVGHYDSIDALRYLVMGLGQPLPRPRAEVRPSTRRGQFQRF